MTDTFTRPTRLQTRSANAQAQFLTSMCVHERAADAQNAINDTVRALGKLLDAIGPTDRLKEIIAALSDEAADISHGFVVEMDDVNLWHDGLELAELNELVGRVS